MNTELCFIILGRFVYLMARAGAKKRYIVMDTNHNSPYFFFIFCAILSTLVECATPAIISPRIYLSQTCSDRTSKEVEERSYKNRIRNAQNAHTREYKTLFCFPKFYSKCFVICVTLHLKQKLYDKTILTSIPFSIRSRFLSHSVFLIWRLCQLQQCKKCS